jgi:hypothetical protein
MSEVRGTLQTCGCALATSLGWPFNISRATAKTSRISSLSRLFRIRTYRRLAFAAIFFRRFSTRAFVSFFAAW